MFQGPEHGLADKGYHINNKQKMVTKPHINHKPVDYLPNKTNYSLARILPEINISLHSCLTTAYLSSLIYHSFPVFVSAT